MLLSSSCVLPVVGAPGFCSDRVLWAVGQGAPDSKLRDVSVVDADIQREAQFESPLRDCRSTHVSIQAARCTDAARWTEEFGHLRELYQTFPAPQHKHLAMLYLRTTALADRAAAVREGGQMARFGKWRISCLKVALRSSDSIPVACKSIQFDSCRIRLDSRV